MAAVASNQVVWNSLVQQLALVSPDSVGSSFEHVCSGLWQAQRLQMHKQQGMA